MKKMNYECPALLGLEIETEAGFAASAGDAWSDTGTGSADMEVIPGEKDDEWA